MKKRSNTTIDQKKKKKKKRRRRWEKRIVGKLGKKAVFLGAVGGGKKA